MIKFPKVKIIGVDNLMIFVQGGMGIGVSMERLARAVAREGGIGVVSSAGLDYLHWKKYGQKAGVREATRREIVLAKAEGGFVGINCMVAVRYYKESVFGALDSQVDAIISGAGLPLALPRIVNEYELDHPGCSVALIPIVSSVRALEIIFKHWEKKNKRYPDAVVLEGPKAGGHLGFSFSDIEKDEYRLESLFPAVKKFAEDNGNFPVIVAGGIFNNQDIVSWTNLGADGVQMGSRFAATIESDASPEFKQAILDSKEGDIIVSKRSPCGLPFRVIKSSPGYLDERHIECTKGFVLRQENGSLVCLAKSNSGAFCICSVLLAAVGFENDFKPVYTIGTEGWRIEKILSVKELMYELGVRN